MNLVELIRVFQIVLANVISFAVLKILHNSISIQKSLQVTVEVSRLTKSFQCHLTFIFIELSKTQQFCENLLRSFIWIETNDSVFSPWGLVFPSSLFLRGPVFLRSRVRVRARVCCLDDAILWGLLKHTWKFSCHIWIIYKRWFCSQTHKWKEKWGSNGPNIGKGVQEIWKVSSRNYWYLT